MLAFINLDMSIGNRIREARKAKGESQEGLGKAIGVAQTTISAWERGRKEEPTREEVARIAAYLQIPITQLEESSEPLDERHARIREIPVISWVSAGRLQEVSDLATLSRKADTMPVTGLPGGEYFATVVRGDSMDRVSPEGSRIIVNVSDREPRPGRYYLFSLRGEATYKRFQSDPVIRLEPFSTNPANTIIFPKSDLDWNVIGRVVRSYIDFN